ncbi:MAG: carbon starvation protein A [Planctomycetota bacterium]
MTVLLLVFVAAGLLVVAYLTYGRWLATRVFQLDRHATCPSESERDDRDFVPTAKSVVFGHHFTSIAGTGPIVGPAIAVMWGWLPALLWVVFGSILVGAVHDLGSLVVSLRNKGRSIGDIAGDILGPRARLLFLCILIVGLWIVLAVFGLVIAAVLRQSPAAITPVLVQVPLALAIGALIHRKGRSIVLPSIIALATMYLSVIFGDAGPLHAFNQTLASMPMWAWTALLLAYAYVASVLPVWTLLQPRDYINALQLLTCLALLVAGLIAAGLLGGHAPSTVMTEPGERTPLAFVAPMINWQPIGAPPLLPMLFITVACGACSGFHCLVGSGTTSKQLTRETDARAVGYGAMLTEGFLATLVIAACAAGIGLGVASGAGDAVTTGIDAFNERYQSWSAAGSLGAKVSAFVDGSANFLAALGIPLALGATLIAVMVASFAATTMDTACRLQRYVVQELARTFVPTERRASRFNPARLLATTHGATLFAVITAALLASVPASGQPWSLDNAGAGGLILWPLFGATNQLLAGFAFVVIVAWLSVTKRPTWFAIPAAALMLVVPACAMFWQAFIGNDANPSWLDARKWLLVIIACITLALEAWLLIEAGVRAKRGYALLRAYKP